MAIEHAETIIQLALTGLLSAPVIQTVFQHTDEPKPQDPESEPSSESLKRTETTTMTDDFASASPVVLAPPVAITKEQERQLFVQNALHGGQFNTTTQEERVLIEKPTEVQEPQTAGLEEDKSPLDTNNTNTDDPEKMGILSVLTGNISPPADLTSPSARDSTNGHGIISNDLQATTVGPTTKQGIVRSDTVKSHLTSGTTGTHGTERSGTPAFAGERAATPLGERAVTPVGDRSPTPLPASTTEERGPISGATGDGYSPLPVAALHTTGDVPRETEFDEGRGQVSSEPLNDRAEVPVHGGVEEGVPASVGADGRYEGVRGEETLTRPP